MYVGHLVDTCLMVGGIECMWDTWWTLILWVRKNWMHEELTGGKL